MNNEGSGQIDSDNDWIMIDSAKEVAEQAEVQIDTTDKIAVDSDNDWIMINSTNIMPFMGEDTHN